MLKSILWFLFPKTLNQMIWEVNTIAHYGSLESFYQQEQLMAQAQEEEERYIESQMDVDEFYHNWEGKEE